MKGLIKGVVTGWLLLVSSIGFYLFGMPHDKWFAPAIEGVGLEGTFLFFGVLFTAYYFSAFVLVVWPYAVFPNPLRKARVCYRVAAGVPVFLLCVLSLSFVIGQWDRKAIPDFIVFLTLPASACFYFLEEKTPMEV